MAAVNGPTPSDAPANPETVSRLVDHIIARAKQAAAPAPAPAEFASIEHHDNGGSMTPVD
jgi:hypothetical protein